MDRALKHNKMLSSCVLASNGAVSIQLPVVFNDQLHVYY